MEKYMKLDKYNFLAYIPSSTTDSYSGWEIEITKEEEAWIYKVFSDFDDVQNFIESKLRNRK